MTVVHSSNDSEKVFAPAVRHPGLKPRAEGIRDGALSGLAASLNQSPIVQAQLVRRQELDNSPSVQSLLSLQRQIHAGPGVVTQARRSEHSAEEETFAELRSGTNNHQEPVQRKVLPYQDKTSKKDMENLAGVLNECVEAAKGIVDSNPLLTGVDKRKEGYLGAWVTCFDQFTSDGEIPDFFYARYGYAIETLATAFFKTKDHNGYAVITQFAQGSTRPDFVISDKVSQIAWLDITSSSSAGHILAKQGGGWKTRPYVAEILYDMPKPADFAKTATGKLTKEQKEKLEKADAARAQRELRFDQGMQAMSLVLAEAYKAAREKKGDLLSRKDVKTVTVQVCQDKLNSLVDGGITPSLAAGVLGSIASIEVEDRVDTGLSWATWAFKSVGARWSEGRAVLWGYGKKLAGDE